MRKALFLGILIMLLAGGAFVYWQYYKVYDDGFREGELLKFSRKGDLFKTYEGELVQLAFGGKDSPLSPRYFYFSVTDERVADSLEKCIGSTVRLHYRQFKGYLPWRGERYDSLNNTGGQVIVDRIDQVRQRVY